MKLHRFYVGGDIELKHDLWLRDEAMLHQWRNVLRFNSGQDLVLFDGIEHDRLYKIIEINSKEVHLKQITDQERKLPKRDIFLLFAILKKDKNDWVLQKCTELGVSHFMPLLADRSEKTGFNTERAKKIVIEASEQCGRSDIPTVREPMNVLTAIEELKDRVQLFVCEQEGEAELNLQDKSGVLIGPEGGWSDNEKRVFKDQKLNHLNLHDFTLRAETAAVAAAAMLIQ